MQVNLVISRLGDEVWYVVTNLEDKRTALRWYERRMTIEESFRDAKSLLEWKRFRVTTLPRVERLLLGLVVAYLVLALLGAEAHRRGFKRYFAAKKDRVSLVWLITKVLEAPQWVSSTDAGASITKVGRNQQIASSITYGTIAEKEGPLPRLCLLSHMFLDEITLPLEARSAIIVPMTAVERIVLRAAERAS